MTERPYLGADDLPALVAFGSASVAQRFPLNANWHPRDFIWELRGEYGRPQPIRMWEDASGVVAVGWMVDAGKLWLETLPGGEALVPEIVAWAEDGLQSPSVRAFARDIGRIAAMKRLGYALAGPEGVCFRMDLAALATPEEPPAGFALRDCIGIDPERRAAAHRDAWNDLSRIGLPEARSTFAAATYASLSAAPVYDPTLDILVEAPDGLPVANCIAWADPASGIGVFEPVGTHAAFRGRGLARLAILEACRRLRARGHRWAQVGTAHFNAPAISAYLSCGFVECDFTHWWTKAL